MGERTPLTPEQREAALRDLMGADRSAMIKAAKLLESEVSTTPTLLALLETERRVDTRHAILYTLSWHGDLKTWDLMVRIFLDPKEAPLVRGQAAEGLAYMFSSVSPGSREFEVGVAALTEALKDPEPEVRYCSLFALGATKHPPLIPLLKEMLADRTPVPGWIGTVADKAAEAIERIEWAEKMRREKGR